MRRRSSPALLDADRPPYALERLPVVIEVLDELVGKVGEGALHLCDAIDEALPVVRLELFGAGLDDGEPCREARLGGIPRARLMAQDLVPDEPVVLPTRLFLETCSFGLTAALRPRDGPSSDPHGSGDRRADHLADERRIHAAMPPTASVRRAVPADVVRRVRAARTVAAGRLGPVAVAPASGRVLPGRDPDAGVLAAGCRRSGVPLRVLAQGRDAQVGDAALVHVQVAVGIGGDADARLRVGHEHGDLLCLYRWSWSW